MDDTGDRYFNKLLQTTSTQLVQTVSLLNEQHVTRFRCYSSERIGNDYRITLVKCKAVSRIKGNKHGGFVHCF